MSDRMSAFLRLVLPSRGIYALWTKQDKRHYYFDTIEALCTKADTLSAAGYEVYHACASFSEKRRSGETAHALRALRTDVDIRREGKQTAVYGDVAEAEKQVRAFSAYYHYPDPTFIYSGNGLHPYWPADRDLDPATWLRLATLLQARMDAFGLSVDRQVTTDLARILRPPDTYNLKDPSNPKLVRAGELAGPYDPALFEGVTDGNLHRVALQNGPARGFAPVSPMRATSIDVVRRACKQFEAFEQHCEKLTEPQWRAFVVTAGCCSGGKEYAHIQSSKDTKRYDPKAIDYDIEYWHKKSSRPPTCDYLRAELGKEACQGCQLERRRGASPTDAAETEQILVQRDGLIVPDGFAVHDDGSLWTTGMPTSVASKQILVCNTPFSYVGLREDETKKSRSLLRFNGYERSVDEHFLKHKAHASCAGIDVRNVDLLGTYISACADIYRKAFGAMQEFNTMGWKDEHFVYTKEPAVDYLAVMQKWFSPSPNASLAAWREATEVFFEDGMELYAGFLYLGFSGPLMSLLSWAEGGAIAGLVSAETGMGKSFVLMCALSIWGHRDMDTNANDTHNSYFKKLSTLRHITQFYDEMRFFTREQAATWVQTFCSGREKTRLNRATELTIGNAWCTSLLFTSNVSLVSMLTDDFGEMDAWAWRVLELYPALPRPPNLLLGTQLGEIWFNNRGIAGQRFIEALNEVGKERLTQAVKEEYEHLERYTSWPADARFYLRLLACANVAGRIAHHYGILAHAPEPYIGAIIAHVDQRPCWTDSKRVAQNQIAHLIGGSRRYTIDDKNPNAMMPGSELYSRIIRARNVRAISVPYARKWCSRNRVNYERMVATLGLKTEFVDLTEMDPGASKALAECLIMPVEFHVASVLAPAERNVVPFRPSV